MSPRSIATLMICAAGWVAAAAAQASPTVWTEARTGMTFVRVAKACHRIGSAKRPFPMMNQYLRDIGYTGDFSANEQPAHEVCLSEYWIAEHEVTAEQWQQVMSAPAPQGQGKEAVAQVSWMDAQRFAERLTALGGPRDHFRLPTEAEWEVACLAGQPDPLKVETSRATYAPYAVFNRGGKDGRLMVSQPAPVKTLKPNAWGLYDMRGNVWEWTLDNYQHDAYRKHALYNPLLQNGAGERVIRGGSFRSETVQMRCANRGFYAAPSAMPTIGFRLVREVGRP